MSVTKIAGEYNLLIIFLNQDYTEDDGNDWIKNYIYEFNGQSWDETAPQKHFAVWVNSMKKADNMCMLIFM